MPATGQEDSLNLRNSLCVVGAEALLVVLPFLVIAIVLLSKGEFSEILYTPAWGVAASALIGLSMVRFVTGMLYAGDQLERLAWERVLLVFSAIVVFAFVPSLLVLSLVVFAKAPSSYLAAAQLLLFLLGLSLYIVLGWTAQHVMTGTTNRNGTQRLEVMKSRAAGD